MSWEAPPSSCTSQDAVRPAPFLRNVRERPVHRQRAEERFPGAGHRGSSWGEMKMFWNWLVVTAPGQFEGTEGHRITHF